MILTCYHVIGYANSEDETFYDNLRIYFPETNTTLSAGVKEEYCNSKYDIAFLYIKETEKIPDGLKVAPLSKEVFYGNRFSSWGLENHQYINY